MFINVNLIPRLRQIYTHSGVNVGLKTIDLMNDDVTCPKGSMVVVGTPKSKMAAGSTMILLYNVVETESNNKF